MKRANQTLTYLHSFAGYPSDGNSPYGPLVSVSGTLYGTTFSGGSHYGNGTVYSITPSGTYAVLHNFTNGSDGSAPYAGLISLSGSLYGTTFNGGAYSSGTFYSITTSGTESVIQSFYSGSDGANPVATLIAPSGVLYGATSAGGVYNGGTVFSMTTAGAETVLHSFGGSGDGSDPQGPLLDSGSTLYGTTVYTGGGQNGCGTVFAVNKTTGAETVLHTFSGEPDGCNPGYGRLVLVNGTIYGTTQNGGGGCNCGTIYSLTTSGTESVLHSFTAGVDGSSPLGGLSTINGTFYGTTNNGGVYSEGTIYSITPSASGSYAVIWAFGGSPGGAHPKSDLIVVNGTLYGTTTSGGANNLGTVFSLLSI
ncbi:MAG TPA: choice-of-anchor tandem repeat GloVer-containing protein [Candidatus Cybelea sp.]|nr:choice-of-anchor tandem repeat GloVer-containing protein [Candidatus Cybelea sp.]